MSAVNIHSLAYLGFESPNTEAWPEFATQIFGFGLATGPTPGSVYLRTDSRHHRIALHPGEVDRLAYLGWNVQTPEELAAARETVAAAGYAVVDATQEELEDRSVLGMFSTVDPAGFRHEFAWGQAYEIATFIPGRPMDGFVAEDAGLGHAVLVAEVTAEYKRFLLEVLGLRTYTEFPVSMPDGRSGRCLFLRCNEKTHCLGVLGLPGMHGFQHFEVEARSLHDVGIAYDLVQERDVPITLTLGSHTIDPVVSFYCRTPSGFDLEFAYGGVTLPENAVVGRPVKPEIWGHKFTGVGLPATIHPLAAHSRE